MPPKSFLRSLVRMFRALAFGFIVAHPLDAQTIQIDSIVAKRTLARADVTFRSGHMKRRALDAFADSLVAIALQGNSSATRSQGTARVAVMRLGMAGSDPKIDYRGAAPRLLRIALETTDEEVGRVAINSLRNMTDTAAAVVALTQLATDPRFAFSAVLQLGHNYWDSERARDAMRALYANRSSIPDRTAREYLEERVRLGGLLRKP